jgi:chromosomal replication initiation ATPase DnaA
MSRPSRKQLGAIFRRAFIDLDDIEAALEVTFDTVAGLATGTNGSSLTERIKKETAAYYGLAQTQLKSRSRAYAISRPRSVAWWLIRRYDKSTSLPAMGKALGGFHHSTVIYAIGLVERRSELMADAVAIWARLNVEEKQCQDQTKNL